MLEMFSTNSRTGCFFILILSPSLHFFSVRLLENHTESFSHEVACVNIKSNYFPFLQFLSGIKTLSVFPLTCRKKSGSVGRQIFLLFLYFFFFFFFFFFLLKTSKIHNMQLYSSEILENDRY